MRSEQDSYWTVSLPKDHAALHALDAFCVDWGGLTRTEATRRILIEWDKILRGQDVSAWGAQASVFFTPATVPERGGRVDRSVHTAPVSHAVAKAASQVLDE